MTPQNLRQYIKNQAKKFLNEEMEAAALPPADFAEFRRRVVEGCRHVKGLSGLIDLIGDIGYEGDLVVPVYEAWCEMMFELERADNKVEAWNQAIDDVTYQLLGGMASVLRDPWNFAPGERPRVSYDVDTAAYDLADQLRL